MKFTIFEANEIYGGGPAGPQYKKIREDISQEHVDDFFKPIELIEDKIRDGFKTEADNMGCCTRYKVMVTGL